ncbi:MAG: type IX secretion system outer membrane channel protein PorV [Bacteroidales bacterium]|jgi:hypothetical protein|nr:type IX secretion system outer membrane channel protein PorV [Bacteroidales bacterium]
MKKKTLIILLSILFVPCKQLTAQSKSDRLNAIHTVAPFLTIAPDSRAGGMGDVGVATSPDIFSQHWNPAKFAFIDSKSGVGLSYSPWLRTLVPDINIALLTGFYRIDSKQVISSSLLYSSLGDIPFTDDLGNFMRNFTPNEFALDAAYSRLFTEKLSGSIAFRFIYSNLTGGTYSGGTATKPGISYAADISGFWNNDILLLNKDANIAVGLSLSNIGAKMSYADATASYFIPMNMRLGGALKIDLDSYNSISLALDLNKLLVPTQPLYSSTEKDKIIAGKDPDISVPLAIFQSFYDAPGGFREEMHEITTSTGIEYWYNNTFALRGGYFREHETKGNRKYFTAGAGFKLNAFTLDFSYLMPAAQHHPLARTLRFSLAFDMNYYRASKPEA